MATTPTAPQDPAGHAHEFLRTGDGDFACMVKGCYLTWDPEGDDPRPEPSTVIRRS